MDQCRPKQTRWRLDASRQARRAFRRHDVGLDLRLPGRGGARARPAHLEELPPGEGPCRLAVEGQDLESRLRERGALPVPLALKVARQAALGLEDAVRLDIIHRDIKPANIILDLQENVKLTDFGLTVPATEPLLPAALRSSNVGDTPSHEAG